VIALVFCFVIIYEVTCGPIAWIYAIETVIDSGLGICYFFLWGTVLLVSIGSPILMEKDSLGSSTVFFIFGGISLVATVYVYLFIKETKGLLDKKKKNIFMPDNYKKVENILT